MDKPMTKQFPPLVDLDQMLEWIEREEVIYASSTAEPKRLYVRMGGGYRVEVRDETVYSGTDGRSAVNAYNEAR